MGLAAAPRRRFSLTAFASLLFALSLLAKLGTLLYLRLSARPRDYSYVGWDHPQEWPVARPYIQHTAQHTTRFTLAHAEAAAEWAALAPGDGLIYLGPQRQPYSISMLHQLRCLDVVRAELVRPPLDGPTPLARHCLNYVKQMVLCRGDTHLEPFTHPNNRDPINTDQVYECRDWGAVYEKVRENQAEYAKWKDSQQPEV